jgi:hypothetical protein
MLMVYKRMKGITLKNAEKFQIWWAVLTSGQTNLKSQVFLSFEVIFDFYALLAVFKICYESKSYVNQSVFFY